MTKPISFFGAVLLCLLVLSVLFGYVFRYQVYDSIAGSAGNESVAHLTTADFQSVANVRFASESDIAKACTISRLRLVGRSADRATIALTLSSSFLTAQYPTLRINFLDGNGAVVRFLDVAPDAYSHAKVLSRAEEIVVSVPLVSGERRFTAEVFSQEVDR